MFRQRSSCYKSAIKRGSLLDLWERAHLIRSFLWSHDGTDERPLAKQYLLRVRRLFDVDFCFVVLFGDGGKTLEVGSPEDLFARVPTDFVRRSLDLVSNARVAFAWKQSEKDSGFPTTVISPLSLAIGQPVGFLMLGHSTPRNFSATELLLVQALASELSWAVRDIQSKKQYQRLLTSISYEIKDPLNIIIGHSTLLCESLARSLSPEQQEQFQTIEAGAAEILKVIKRSSYVNEVENQHV